MLPNHHRTGALFCLASAAGFGAMGVFGKLAYRHGATVGSLLAIRFALAAAVLWLILLTTRRASLSTLRRLPRRDVGLALGLGALGYSAQAGAYFAALDRLDASLLALLLYTFPIIVTVAAIALGREAFSTRTAAALGLASGGLLLVLAGAAAGALDPLGTALGLIAAVVYSAYILVSEGVTRRVDPLLLSTLVCTGAAATLMTATALGGWLHLGALDAGGFGWIAAIALVSTVAAVGLFFAGLAKVGPSSAAILSTFEPVVTVTLAFLVFGESFSPAQLLGGALVLSAVILVRARSGAPAPRLALGDAAGGGPVQRAAARAADHRPLAVVEDRAL